MHEQLDPLEMVKRDKGELTLALRRLDALTTPELVRPPVPHGDPPTGELVTWAVKVYFYSALCQFRELLRATLLLVDADHVSAVFFCCRGSFELAAHAYYVKKHVLQYLRGCPAYNCTGAQTPADGVSASLVAEAREQNGANDDEEEFAPGAK